MSAKKSNQRPNPPAAASVASSPVPAAGAAGAATAEPSGSWLESADPKKRLIAKIAFVGIWIYVAALWLLALDQWFNWGIFGPKIPPTP